MSRWFRIATKKGQSLSPIIHNENFLFLHKRLDRLPIGEIRSAEQSGKADEDLPRHKSESDEIIQITKKKPSTRNVNQITSISVLI